jgi:hypothetical protein
MTVPGLGHMFSLPLPIITSKNQQMQLSILHTRNLHRVQTLHRATFVKKAKTISTQLINEEYDQ